MKLVAFLTLAFAILLTPRLPNRAGVAAATSEPVVKAQVVVQNSYYAKPGMEDDVMRIRVEASAVLRSLGVRTGRILRRTKNQFDVVGADDPDVVWECDFPDEASLIDDARIARASSQFAAVQKRMAVVARKFETRRWSVHE